LIIGESVSPSEEYARRLREREAEVARLDKLHERIGTGRLTLGAVTLLCAWVVLYQRALAPVWLLSPVAAFLILVLVHGAVRRKRLGAERAVNYYKQGIARLEDRWSGQGPTGDRFATTAHIYAADLDLFGHDSLFQLLSQARTRMGEETLAKWLLAPGTRSAITGRQASIVDLRERLDLREEIAVLGETAEVGVRPEALLAWAQAPNRLPHRWLLWVGCLLPALAILAAVIWSLKGLMAPFILILLIEAGVTYAVRKQVAVVLRDTDYAFRDLKLFAGLLVRIERGSFTAPALQELVRRLSSQNRSASATIGRLARVTDFADARNNPFLRPLDTPLFYSVHVALAAERWHRDHARVVREWMDAVGEFEALASLATYSYEHPEDPFPELVEGVASLAATELGHPLLPAAKCVRNSVGIEGATRVLLVSGSNMSGKSTLLRTVGINTVLAMAGAPVRARSLRLTPLQVGASIRVNDSLHEGSSRFYAEITRLREIHGLAGGGLPVLFLLDELLQGTNSKDRLMGAEGIVRAFVSAGAIGLVSTHDLALTGIGGLAAGTLRNVHFQDELADGMMRFDFTLREGVVTRSNGIELMRAIGLKV
jgi:hypothetical protein